MLRRVPLASLVCPSAPFLAPRLLYTQTPLATLSAQHDVALARPQRCTYATKITKYRLRNSHDVSQSRKEGGKERQRGHSPHKKEYGFKQQRDSYIRKFAVRDELSSLFTQLWNACRDRKIDVIMDLYPTVVASNGLTGIQTLDIAKAFHEYIRINYSTNRKPPQALPFVEKLADDIRAGKLAPHTSAHMHILSIYKECKMFHQGRAFWQWLVDQDDNFVDQSVYGAAIELLAYEGETSLQQLEELYKDGLKRFPGTFAEYHLSPEAIVPDRTQPTSITGLPIHLLQGILTARILSRDWRRAYLALDTALRLYPTQTPARFFDIFVHERHVSEGYTVFLMACRSGVVLRPYRLTTLMTKLQAYLTTCPSLQQRIQILRGMANAIYAYVESGGTLEGPHIGSFVHTFGKLISWNDHGGKNSEDEVKLRNMITTQAHEIMSILIQAGMPLVPQLFIALIALAGRLGVPELLKVTLQDIENAQMDIGPIGRRGILISAASLDDKELLENCWMGIVTQGELEGAKSSHAYWVTLAKACNTARHQEFFNQQVERLQHTISVDTMRESSLQLHNPLVRDAKRAEQAILMDPAEFHQEIQLLQEQVKNIAAVIMSGIPLDLLANPFYMSLFPEKRTLGAVEDLRAVYDELTTDPHQPAPSPLSEDSAMQVPLSPTSIPLDELRFRNWVNIMELMNEAKTTELEFQRQLDIAIANKQPLEHISKSKLENEAPARAYTRDELRRRIKSLRADSESASHRKGISINQPPNVTPPKSVLRYHVTDNGGPPVSSTSLLHRPLGNPKRGTDTSGMSPTLRNHVSLESYHSSPVPAAQRNTYQSLDSSTPSSATRSPIQELEEVANNNSNNNNKGVTHPYENL
ncbi:hypothetical protein K504DRAFT_428385 [Pleomassaria siparia CBS 279.74]|uniref:Uncharacterized protein n=1 Tax=Pleomassaria siparia CBS 279.74 TaxID=1314801 RepID=A0A6G1KH26_9PLEO|nr:hypothetical protein K504DRAFT_428385 [Pleomassaria siparia CBS 279.74]